MTIEKKTAADARSAARLDQVRANVTDRQIQRQLDEEGFGSGSDISGSYPSPRTVRLTLKLTQEEIAAKFRIPVGTWRNWEQHRVRIEPAGQALLWIMWREPEAALRALQRDAA